MYLEPGSIPRSGLGPHYFLHQKSKSTFAVDGSPIAGACLFDRNFESFGLCSAGGRRSGGSCPYSLRSLQKDFSLRIGQESQNQFEQDPKRQSARWSAGETATVRFALANPPANQFFHTSRTRKSILAG